MIIYDKLPYKGDTYISPNQAGKYGERRSNFSNTLTGPVKADHDGFTIYYSVKTPDIDSAEFVNDEKNWVEKPNDYSKVTAIKAVLNETATLEAGREVNLHLPMKGPKYEDENYQGVNTFAYSRNGGKDFYEASAVRNYVYIEKIDIDIDKQWLDLDESRRPDEIVVNLLRDGEKFKRAKVTKTDNWKYTFEGLDKRDENGKEYIYTIEEEKVDGYITSIEGNVNDGFTIKNALEWKPIEPGRRNIHVKKIWEGKAQESVTISLLADDEVVDSIELSEKNNWEYTFRDLPVVKNIRDDEIIKYTVEELEIKGYRAEITGNSEKGFTITNIEEPTDPEEPIDPEDLEEPENMIKDKNDGEKDEGKDLPKTGTNSNVIFYIIGLALIIMGLIFRKRRI